jgi:integrase/recombinase XerC
VPHLSATTLTTDEQRLILRATAGNLRDHVIFSVALGTGLRLAEIVGLDVADVFTADGTPRVRVPDGPVPSASPTPPRASR